MNSSPSSVDYIRPGRVTARVIVSFAVVTFFTATQVLLICLGWGAALDYILITFPVYPAWLDDRLIRFLGLLFGFVCVVYPVYFGLFRLGFQIQPLLDTNPRPKVVQEPPDDPEAS